jgi:pyrroloquinoline quinone (PQQ) biosynthesis protein C
MQLQEIQRQVASLLYSTPLIDGIQNGRATQAQYRAYLADAYYYTQHSSQVVSHAGTRLADTHPALSRYMLDRATDKLNQQSAAVQDLRELGLSNDDIIKLSPSSPCLRMIALEYYYAKEDNPVGVLAWMFALQSLGVTLAPNLAQLNHSLKLNGRGMSFLTRRGPSILKDVEELARLIGEARFSPADEQCFLRAARESADLYCAMLDVAFAASESVGEEMDSGRPQSSMH